MAAGVYENICISLWFNLENPSSISRRQFLTLYPSAETQTIPHTNFFDIYSPAMDKTKAGKKTKRGKAENLNRRPVTKLDARCLEWKRRSRARAEAGPSAAALAAAAGNLGPSVQANALSFETGERPPSPTPDPFDIDPPVPNADLFEYSQAMNQGFDAGRRQREEENWQLKHASMFPVFLACKVKTKNWADPDLAMNDWKPACNCSAEARTLDVLDILSLYQ